MCDEESFVILGTSPNGSLRSNQLILEPAEESMKQNGFASNSSTIAEQVDTSKAPTSITTDVTGNTIKNTVLVNMPSQSSSVFDSLTNVPVTSSASSNGAGAATTLKSLSGSTIANDKSLAASFIMGEIPVNVLKSSVFSQFPSLSSELSFEEIDKLQKIFSENVAMKDTLMATNGALKNLCERFSKYEEEKRKSDKKYQKQIEELEAKVEKMLDELQEARNTQLLIDRNYAEAMDHITASKLLMKHENSELARNVSDLTSVMHKMRTHIDTLEQQQLSSFEFIRKSEEDKRQQPDFVSIDKHKRAVYDLQRNMDVNDYELSKTLNEHMDEINCLKVNLTAAEELLSKTRGDLNFFKAKNIDQVARIELYDDERRKMRAEMDALRQQVEIYSKDFELERLARSALAGEKDQLLQDLRTLQQRNQKLIEQQQRQLEAFERIAAEHSAGPSTSAAAAAAVAQNNAEVETTSTSTSTQTLPVAAAAATTTTAIATTATSTPQATSTPERSSKESRLPFCCPICSRRFQSLNILETHVNACLDSN